MFYAILSKKAVSAAVMTAIVVGMAVPSASAADWSLQQPDSFVSTEMPAFLEGTGATALSPAEMTSVQGEGWPIALYYAVIAAPSLTALLHSSIANHFPLMLIRHAWDSLR